MYWFDPLCDWNIMDNDFYDQLEPKVFKAIAERIKGSGRTLEIGCGDCRLANYLVKNTGCNVVAVDIKEESRELKGNSLVKYIRGDAEFLSSFLKDKFDICVSLYVLHELKNPLNVLEEAKKILKQKGKIIMIDFPKGSIADKLYDENFYTPSEMKSLLKKSGFKNVHIEFLTGKELAYLIGTK